MELDTLPKFLVEHARKSGEQPAYREKDLGIWQTWSWAETENEIRNLACGLKTLGFERGDKLAIIGDNRPCLYWAMVASQCLGGTPVPLYQDSVAEEMKFVLANAEVRFAVVENQEDIGPGGFGDLSAPIEHKAVVIALGLGGVFGKGTDHV